MRLRLEPERNVPIYVQIKEEIRALIEVGRLQTGEQLPTIRELASDLGVNYNTVARAYRELAREGVILTQRGRGSFVGDLGDEGQAARTRQHRLETIASTAATEARRLGYTPSEFAAALVKSVSRWRKEVGETAQ